MFASFYPVPQHPSVYNTKANPYFQPRSAYPGLSFVSHPSLLNLPSHQQFYPTHHLPLGPTTASPYYKDHLQLFQELVVDRQRDLNSDLTIKKLLDSARFSRRSDHTVRHIMQGRPIDKREIVRDILADRVKDQAVAELISFILEDRKYNRTLDQIVLHLQAGVPVPVPDEAESLVKRERQRRFDSQVAQELQTVLLNDFSSQFGAGVNRPWGYSTEPLSSQTASIPLPYIPISTTTDYYSQRNFPSQCSYSVPLACFSGCSPSSEFQSGQCGPMSGQSSMCPGQSSMMSNMMPGQSSMWPGQSSMMPGQSSMMPGQSSMMHNMMPGQSSMMSNMMPGQSSMWPGQSSMMPGQSSMMPGQSSMMPGQSSMTIDPMQTQQHELGPNIASLASAIASGKYM